MNRFWEVTFNASGLMLCFHYGSLRLFQKLMLYVPDQQVVGTDLVEDSDNPLCLVFANIEHSFDKQYVQILSAVIGIEDMIQHSFRIQKGVRNELMLCPVRSRGSKIRLDSGSPD